MDENKVNDVSTEEQSQVEAEVVEETAAEAETESTGAQEEVVIEEKQKIGFVGFIKNCFSRKNIKKTIAVILLVLIAGGAAGAYFHFTSPEYIALRFTEACVDTDLATEEKFLAYDMKAMILYNNDCFGDEEKFFELQSDEFQEDIESWDDYYKVNQKAFLESLEDITGDYTTECEVVKSKDMSERKLKEDCNEELSSYEDHAGLNIDDIGAGKLMTVKVKYDTEDAGVLRFKYSVVLGKVSGLWKVIAWSTDRVD